MAILCNLQNLTDQNISLLTDLLYQNLEDAHGWEPFLLQLNRLIGTKIIHIVAQNKANAALLFSAHANIPLEDGHAHLHKHQLIELRLRHLTDKPPGHWVHDHEMVEGDRARHPLTQKYPQPLDVKYLSICKLIDDVNGIVFLGIFNTPSQGPLSEDCLEFLNKLLPHIRRVCRLTLQSSIYSSQALFGQGLVNKLRQPVILVSVNGEVVHANEAAERMLQANNLVRIDPVTHTLQMPQKYRQVFLDECSAMEISSKKTEGQPIYKFKALQITSPKHKTLYAFLL